MHIGVVPDNLLERTALASGLVPTPVVMGFFGMGHSRCLLAGTRLGVFEALAKGPRSAAEVAAAIEGHEVGTGALLVALAGFGYLRRREGRFSNTKLTERWLLSSAKWSVRDAVLFMADLWDQMGGLEGAVQRGEVGDFHDPAASPEHWERYMRGLACMARPLAGEVVKKVRTDAPPRRLLDVGGGHGLFSVAFCKRHPELRAEVFDLPPAAAVGRRIVEEEGLAERVSFREGDFRTDGLCGEEGDGSFDLVLLFNVVHNASAVVAPELISRCAAALRPGGTLAVLDSVHRPEAGRVSAVGGFNELFFFVLNGTQAYPEEQLEAWVEAAGLRDRRTARLRFLPEVIVTGRRSD